MLMANYERNLDHEQWMRRRLSEAVELLADNSADKLGRLMGYTNGGFVREILKGTKPVGKAIVARIESVPGGAGWFDNAPPPRDVKDSPATYGVWRPNPRVLKLLKRLEELPEAQSAAVIGALSGMLDAYEAQRNATMHSLLANPPFGAPTSAARLRKVERELAAAVDDPVRRDVIEDFLRRVDVEVARERSAAPNPTKESGNIPST